MPAEDYRTLVRLVDIDDLDRDEVREILNRYFEQNVAILWRVALENYGLLRR